jgi:hypothetical protein
MYDITLKRWQVYNVMQTGTLSADTAATTSAQNSST